jgi:two-component system CheB/CheR fusion protein
MFRGGLISIASPARDGGLLAATFQIVSLCGSAGALDAFVEIVHAAPIDSGMAFVILTHRRIEFPSKLVEILSRVTAIPVEEIEDGTLLKQNRIYVGPAGMDVTTDGEAFQVVPSSKPYGWPNTFDVYLRSVALNTRDRAITVILSGMAADGSASLGELKASGGINYAQTDATTESMPQNAIATGNVDYQCTLAQIIDSILSLVPR